MSRPGLARGSAERIGASGALGLLPPPLWGRGGEGGGAFGNVGAPIARPPPPTPPHKGEGSTASVGHPAGQHHPPTSNPVGAAGVAEIGVGEQCVERKHL